MKNFRYYLLIFSLLLLLFSFGCNNATGPDYPPGTVKGRILDSATHLPLAGVRITSVPVSSFSSVSDTAGYYVLGGIPMASSATTTYITATRLNYISTTIGYWLHAEDTATINFILSPTNGVFIANDIQVQQYLGPNSFNSLDLYLLKSVIATGLRDIDLRDSAGTGQNFRFYDSYSSGQIPGGYSTNFGNSVGYYTKEQFDTLAMYYGAHEPFDTLLDFPNTKTEPFYTPLTGSPVYPFYLYGRHSFPYPNVYGLLYIKSTYIDPSNVFNVIVDVKINRNGQNLFYIKN
jgi:hypothetical protein